MRLVDHKVFAPIRVSPRDAIQFTYTHQNGGADVFLVEFDQTGEVEECFIYLNNEGTLELITGRV